MSHTTTINVVPIRDLAALEQAVQRLKDRGVNCSLEKNARPRMYFRQQETVHDYVLRLHDGKYDVGFAKQKDGSYLPAYDEYNNYVGNQLAVNAPACPMPGTSEERALKQIGMFSQEYARCSAVNAASAQGYFVTEESIDAQTGEYQLVFSN